MSDEKDSQMKEFRAQQAKFLDAAKRQRDQQERAERKLAGLLDPSEMDAVAKDEMMEAIMPYIRILGDMIEKQVVHIDELEAEIDKLKQRFKP